MFNSEKSGGIGYEIEKKLQEYLTLIRDITVS